LDRPNHQERHRRPTSRALYRRSPKAVTRSAVFSISYGSQSSEEPKVLEEAERRLVGLAEPRSGEIKAR
jgi:hypothetical protein